MSGHLKFAIAGVILGLILLAIIPWEVALLIIAAAIAVPTAAWFMLDSSQRRRIREMRRRGQIGR
ncbi:MAG TPA: hypothetical protein VGS62_11170 [Streptosporangiaceae bacterium]|nr:hypothetical protein [Streptosporangiaceae bacterium]